MSHSSSPPAAALGERIDQPTARVGVVGLGYVGLPLAVEFARAGFQTTGIDRTSEPITAEALAAADCVAVLTDHRTIDDQMVRDESRLVVDTRNAIAGEHAHVLKLGAPAPTLREQLATNAA